MSSSSEFDKIARLAARFGSPSAGVLVGIGDDAAVLAPPSDKKLVWTIDEHVEHTHFRRELLGWADEGWRSFMAAASDLAAMGADPWCTLSAIAVPADFDDAALDALTEGQRLASEAVGSPIVGGNLSRAEHVTITTTLLGTCERAITRGGAVVGDRIFLAGPVGLARAGFLALERRSGDPSLRPAIAAWLRPIARIEEGRAMSSARTHAAIDVSDGLAQDVGHVARASGVSIVLSEGALLRHSGDVLARAAAALGIDAIDLALHGGEDYALVASGDSAIPGFVEIGHVEEGSGVVLATAAGSQRLETRGFDHFRS